MFRAIAGFMMIAGIAAAGELPVVGEVEKLADGFGFTEGPVWDTAGNALYFSDLKTKKIHRWTRAKGVEVVREGGEMPNGLARDPAGGLIVCEPGAQRIVRRDDDGSEKVLVERVSGKTLGHINDVWRAPDGGFYFTIPNPPNSEDDGRLRGVIVHVDHAGDAKVVSEHLDLKSPNGITGSADGKKIYYTNRGKGWVASVGPGGLLSDPQIAADTGWDGLALDEDGNLYTTDKEGVGVYGPAGEPLGVIAVPEKVANFCVGGEDGRTLFITARTGLYAIPIRDEGG